MLIQVTPDGRLELKAPQDFGRFAIRVDPRASAAGLGREALSAIARLDGEAHAWVSPEALRRMVPAAGEPEWEAGFARMLDFARSRGWVDEHGSIRAHIESDGAASVAARLPRVEPDMFKAAMRNLAGGVAIVTTGGAEARNGLTVTAITSVSAEPPTILVCVNTGSSSHDAIVANGSFGVSLLGPEHEALARRFAGEGGLKGAARFAGETWRTGPTGAPLLASALCAMDCQIVTHHAVGSHSLFIGRVVETRHRSGTPLVNFQGRLQTLSAT